MDDPIIIEFKTVGVDEVGRDMAPLVSSLDGLNKSIQDAAKAFAAMKAASNAGAGGVRQAASAAKAATGPFQQLADAQGRLNKAMTGGNSTAIKDAMVNLKRRQAAAHRADNLLNPKPIDPLQDMIRTARVFIGPTGNLVFNPLVNRMMGAGGPQAARAIQQMLGNAWGASRGAGAAGSTPPMLGAGAVAAGGEAAAGASALALPAAGAAAALIGLALVTKMARDRFLALGKTMAISGATFGQAARADRMTAVLGLGNVDQVARGFSDAIAQPGFANAIARGIGINPSNSLWTGDLNDVRKLTKALEAITDPSRMDDRTARAFARATGLEDALVARGASPEVRALLLAQKERDSGKMATQSAIDNSIMMNIAMKEFQTNLAELGIVVLPLVTIAMRGLLNVMNVMFPNNYTGAFGGPPKDQTKAQNLDAIKENTRALNGLNSTLSNGVYGVGSGGRTLPIGAIWDAFNSAGTGRAIEIGAFSL